MRSKTVLIIPAYEPSHNFIDYAREIMDKGFHSIVVINDGSNEKYDSVFDELKTIPSCHVISYKENRGKGYALKAAFKYCLEAYDDSYVFATADCDGQHLCKDVENVAKTAYEHPSKLILGSRDFSLEQVPARSKAGNLNIRRLFRFFYGLSLSDTQTGLRAFSYKLLNKLISIKGDRFEYEMNMLIVFHKSHIDILEVPIETVYHAKEDDVEKVSHFKTFRDSVRVVATLFQNLGWWVVSGTISWLIDLGAFFVLSTFIFTKSDSFAYDVLLATALARIISSIFNFTMNFKIVFNGQSKKSLLKYYILWTFQLATSYGIALFWSTVFNGSLEGIVVIGVLTSLLKSVCDLGVSVISYQIQARWVFVSVERSRVYFYGTFFRIFRHLYNIFNKRYKSFVIAHETQPAVYICNGSVNENLMRLAHNVTFDMHPAVGEHLLKFNTCCKHFADDTFTEKKGRRGIMRFLGKIFSPLASFVFVPLLRALKPVPLSLDVNDEEQYFGAQKYLTKNENILVFVNSSCQDNEKKLIIRNILNIQRAYSNISDTPLMFNVLNIDKVKHEIHEASSFRFTADEDFDAELPKMTQKVFSALS